MSKKKDEAASKVDAVAEIKIRQIKVRDRKLITQLFKKTIKELGDESVKTLISSNAPAAETKSAEEGIGEAIVTIGIRVLTKVIDVYDEDISAWFADLAGLTIDELDDMPIDTEAKIIDQIRTSPEAVGFFTMCFQRAKLMVLLEKPLKIMREKFVSMLESEKENGENTPTPK